MKKKLPTNNIITQQFVINVKIIEIISHKNIKIIRYRNNYGTQLFIIS